MSPRAVALAMFLAGCLGYLGAGYLAFEMPATFADAENCGFLPDEFVAAGELTYERGRAWWVSVLRKEEYVSALSMGLALGFVGYALAIGRRGGVRGTAGAALGGGLLAVSALCVGCLAPVLSVVGLGVAASLLAGIPKTLILLNTLVLTSWGALYLTRRSAAGCPIPATRG